MERMDAGLLNFCFLIWHSSKWHPWHILIHDSCDLKKFTKWKGHWNVVYLELVIILFSCSVAFGGWSRKLYDAKFLPHFKSQIWFLDEPITMMIIIFSKNRVNIKLFWLDFFVFTFVVNIFPGFILIVPLFCCCWNIQCNKNLHRCLCLDDWIWELLLLLRTQGF